MFTTTTIALPRRLGSDLLTIDKTYNSAIGYNSAIFDLQKAVGPCWGDKPAIAERSVGFEKFCILYTSAVEVNIIV